MKRHLLAGLLAIVVAGALAVPGISSAAEGGTAAAAGPFSVVDDVGRTITFDHPAKRAVVLNSYNSDALIALGQRDAIVGEDNNTQARLRFANFADDTLTGPDFSALNYEQIVSLEPDVVIIPRNGVWRAAEKALASFDIPVLVVTAWDPVKWNETVELLGTVFAADDQVAKVLAFTDGVHELVASRTAKAPKLKVYFEDDDYNTATKLNARTYSIDVAGGINLYGDISVSDAATGLSINVDPATIVANNPEVIFKELASSYGGSKPDDLQATADKLLARSGWSDFPAVKDKRVFVYNSWAQELAGRTFQQLYFAKWLHPELFEDVEPSTYVNQWLTEFLRGPSYAGDANYVYQIGSGT
ncbi:MAG TPA: ABC transporter substrate-binding protein [Kaistia sp.]|nr:ABC transporter substrate-binding protein [Kaistia sp.]